MAWVRVLARRASASGRGVWLVLPGLGGVSIYVGRRIVDLLEVVESDTKGFTAAKIIQEGAVCLLGFRRVTLG
jgi:hypothetical protein